MHGYGQQAKWSVFSAEMNDALEQAYLPLLAGDANEATAGDVEITLAAHKYMWLSRVKYGVLGGKKNSR